MRRRLSVMPGQVSIGEEAKLDGLGTENESKKEVGSSGFDKEGVVKCYTSLSRVGYVPFNNRKVNQDRYTEHVNFAGDKKKCLFGVFDGHGAHGHDVSQFLITHLPPMIAKGKNLDKDPREEISRAFMATSLKLDKSAIDINCSGTTAVVCYIVGTKIYTCNSGDSRAVIGILKKGKLVAKALSIDQKPELESEARRILLSGGRVQACRDCDGNPVGPLRVWLKHQDIPGLAMTRSFGDKLAASVGVTCKPEILEHDMKEGEDQFIILGSDGIWEFIENQDAVDIVAESKTAKEAAQALVLEATRRWQKEEEVIDDITATVVYLHGGKFPPKEEKTS
mmetsp:Transcript_23644/g.37207  ORF Transcript_23644/g.37207 Transcript_23644/m.37207 type:complete len:337 (-) Transcript_23644:166-1176(-)